MILKKSKLEFRKKTWLASIMILKKIAREVGSPCEWRGGARHWSRAMVGESGLETCWRRSLEVFPGLRQETLGSLDVKIKNKNIKYIESGDWKGNPHSPRQRPIDRKKRDPFSFPAGTQPMTSQTLFTKPAHLLFPHKRFLLPLLCREVHETSYGFRS